MPETGDLRVSEAVALAHALVARLADLEGVRILFVKGPTAVAQGARPPRPSSDVDVLCEPGCWERLGQALETADWRRRFADSYVRRLGQAGEGLFEHSVHYIHDRWPCDLDIHYNFPGFLAPEAHVFESLWARRTSEHVANVIVPCADLFGQAAIVSLHALRDPKAAHSQADLDFVSNALRRLGLESVREFSTLAADLGCGDTLGPLFERLGVPVPGSPLTDREALHRWSVRTQLEGNGMAAWLIELRNTPWHHQPRLVWRGMFLPRDELFSQHIDLAPRWQNVVRLRARRWGRALRHLPGGIRAARRFGRKLP